MPADTIAFLPDDPLANRICPYPGLRPFNEEESIFFKGREAHIEQIIHQLEQRKFLMLTGASGDGKSSIVYAGVIPNARAGFFKAKHNNWAVADFRPERSPLKNFAASLCKALNIASLDQTEKELSYGFSALIDIYKASSSYLDQSLDEFKNLEEPEKKKRKRKAANLLILVDQFEEFFTNTENYPDGRPSFAAQAVMNVLLETARIALENDIPIYIICTMRSDYIGQCAAFRGLPEYIGYSQFFVPRLNRRELYQVIEEPALLNGDKISKRLVETLISRLDEGIDQLPVLQHALSQIWHCAGKGVEELDLLHFAKVGGLDRKYLNATDKAAFERWLPAVPDFKLPFFAHPSLDNVLDTHANELFERAAAEVNGKPQNEIVSDRDAKLIIETAFKCLTKIDEGRAVRNRMTLQEITQIINRKDLTVSLTGKILNIFRRQGNTFLKPFITDARETEDLDAAIVLDITHESLIRNWAQLTDWARQEYDDFLNFQDFNKQLQRWVTSQRSTGYLLPIGPLTFFEDWFKQAKPNKYWLVKYDQRNISYDQKLAEAEQTLLNASEFLRKSARKLFVNRAIIKYGANKIIAVFGLLLLVSSCIYFMIDFRTKQNGYVIKEIERKGAELLHSKYVSNYFKADFILQEERLHPGSYRELLGAFKIPSQRLDVLRNMIIATLKNFENVPFHRYDPILDSIFIYELDYVNKNHIITDSNFASNISQIVSIAYEDIFVGREDNGLYCSSEIHEKYAIFRDSVYDKFVRFINDGQGLKNINIYQFNKLLQTVPMIVNYNEQRIRKIIDLISPFDVKSVDNFNRLYRDETGTDKNIYHLSQNSGFFQVANLFALCGDVQHLNQSFDSLILHNKDFAKRAFGYDYQILLYDLILSKKIYSADALSFIKKIELLVPQTNPFPVMMQLSQGLIGKEKLMNISTLDAINSSSLQLETVNLFPQKEQISSAGVEELLNFNVELAMESKAISANEQNYRLALLYKAKALVSSVSLEQQNVNFDIAFSYFEKAGKEYLAKGIDITDFRGGISMSHEALFTYPGYISLAHPWVTAKNDFNNLIETEAFILYAAEKKKIYQLYNNCGLSNREFLNQAAFLLRAADDELPNQMNIAPFIDALHLDDSGQMDKDAINAFLALYYFKLGDLKDANVCAGKINIGQLFTKEKFLDPDVSAVYVDFAYRLFVYFLQTEGKSSSPLAPLAAKGVAMKVFKALPQSKLKRNALLIAIDTMQNRGKDAMAIALMDTMLNSYVAAEPSYGLKLCQLLGRFNTHDCNKIAMGLLKDKNENSKAGFVNLYVRGVAESDNYYHALKAIPDYISSFAQLWCYTTVLGVEIQKQNKTGSSCWPNFDRFAGDDWKYILYEGNN